MNINSIVAQEIDNIEVAFLEGEFDKLQNCNCPICKKGKLLYSVHKTLHDQNAPVGRRFRASINIYCQGVCNTMIIRSNGFCPGWAETIDDWTEFSANLSRPNDQRADSGP